ncbi:hypothetical protein GCM10009536_32790 [Streptomyces thermocarboxydus]
MQVRILPSAHRLKAPERSGAFGVLRDEPGPEASRFRGRVHRVGPLDKVPAHRATTGGSGFRAMREGNR